MGYDWSKMYAGVRIGPGAKCLMSCSRIEIASRSAALCRGSSVSGLGSARRFDAGRSACASQTAGRQAGGDAPRPRDLPQPARGEYLCRAPLRLYPLDSVSSTLRLLRHAACLCAGRGSRLEPDRRQNASTRRSFGGDHGRRTLLQPEVYPLMTRLADLGKTVLLETSGAIDIAAVDPRGCA